MINGLGVLGWGVGGIEAEAAMLGQPVTMLIPQVIGFRLERQAAARGDRHRPGAHGHRDAAQERRGRQVRRVLRRRARAICRSPIAPRSPTWRPSTAAPAASSPSTTRPSATWSFPAARASRSSWSSLCQGAGPVAQHRRPAADYTDVLELDLATVEPSLAGPRRPQDRVPLRSAKQVYQSNAKKAAEERGRAQRAARGRPPRV